MAQNHNVERLANASHGDFTSQSRLRFLFVGDVISLRRVSLRLPQAMPLDICQIYDVAEKLRGVDAPDVVLSLAITPAFDCLDLAQMLVMHGFKGRQRIVDLDLPSPRIICREVHQACPDLDFGVLDMAELNAR